MKSAIYVKNILHAQFLLQPVQNVLKIVLEERVERKIKVNIKYPKIYYILIYKLDFGVKLAMVLYVFLSMAIIALLSILFFRLNIKYNDLENDYDNLMEENKQNKFRSYSANKILLDRNLISQLSAKFKYPSYPKIETLDLNLENRIFTLKEELSPHFDNSPITGRNQRGFCTVSLKEGFDIWEKKGKYIYQLYRTDSNDGLQHQNGVLNSQGIYIVAGNADNDVKVYSFANIVHPYPKIALIKTFSRDYLVNTCFVKGSNEVLCPDLGGYVKKYNFTDLSESEFYFEADQEFISGVVTINGIVALGADYGGNLYLLNSDGSENNTYHYNEGDEDHATHQITEIKPGILLTANYIGGIYSHDITDPQNPKFYNLFQSPHTPEQYYSVLSLKKHNYFAVGGRKGANLYGFVTIYSISEDNRGTVQQKYIERKHPSCYISTIREFEGELIAFGGNIFCLQICLWEYSSTHGEPFCWADDTIFDVTDIFLLPQT